MQKSRTKKVPELAESREEDDNVETMSKKIDETGKNVHPSAPAKKSGDRLSEPLIPTLHLGARNKNTKVIKQNLYEHEDTNSDNDDKID